MTDRTNMPELGRWLALRSTWPSDGWDGAAYARATHAAKVRAVEAELAVEHEAAGHGPVEWFGVGQERCVCGTPHKDKPMADLRRIDRYGKWMDPPASDESSADE